MRDVYMVVDLGFGDGGKGATVDYLCQRNEASLVVRYNGGAQAAHNVVTGDGKHHTFSQFGSGTFAGARTHLSRFMLVNPITLLNEAAVLEPKLGSDPLTWTTIEEQAVLTTPFHVALNQLRELSRGDGRHGSCGMGIGETVDDVLNCPDLVLRAGQLKTLSADALFDHLAAVQLLEGGKALSLLPRDRSRTEQESVLWDRLTLSSVVHAAHERFLEARERMNVVPASWLTERLRDSNANPVVFEGAQGVLLDQTYGFAPYTTWSDTTLNNAWTLFDPVIGEFDRDSVTTLGVTRSYMTRHGVGPLPTEYSGPWGRTEHNVKGEWQGIFRRGYLDLALLRYALRTCPVDKLVMNHMDVAADKGNVCVGYKNFDLPLWRLMPPTWEEQLALTEQFKSAIPVYEQVRATEFLKYVQNELNVPVSIRSYGPTAEDRVE